MFKNKTKHLDTPKCFCCYKVPDKTTPGSQTGREGCSPARSPPGSPPQHASQPCPLGVYGLSLPPAVGGTPEDKDEDAARASSRSSSCCVPASKLTNSAERPRVCAHVAERDTPAISSGS